MPSWAADVHMSGLIICRKAGFVLCTKVHERAWYQILDLFPNKFIEEIIYFKGFLYLDFTTYFSLNRHEESSFIPLIAVCTVYGKTLNIRGIKFLRFNENDILAHFNFGVNDICSGSI